MGRCRIILADDHRLVVEGLKALLEPQFDVVAAVSDGRTLVIEADRLKPDLILLDIGMPYMNGIEAARQIVKAAYKAKLVFVTQHTERHYVEAAFRAGASGYVLKEAFLDELTMALQQVLNGGTYLTPLVAKGISEALFSPHRDPGDLFCENLTRRQREVLQLVAEGKTIKEMAALLDISPKTVAFHKAGIMDELGLRTTAELTRYAVHHGLSSV